MISRPEGSRARAAGFTLLEVLVVLAVLGLMAALVVARDYGRHPGLEARAAALTVAQALRTARGRAIATDRSVLVSVNPERRALRIGEDPPLRLAPSLTVTHRRRTRHDPLRRRWQRLRRDDRAARWNAAMFWSAWIG